MSIKGLGEIVICTPPSPAVLSIFARPGTQATYDLRYVPQAPTPGALQPCQLEDGHFLSEQDGAHLLSNPRVDFSLSPCCILIFFLVLYLDEI